MDTIKRIGMSIAHLAVTALTAVSVCGALFVMPSINGGDPSIYWSLAGIASAAAWGAMIWFGDELPLPVGLAFGISACMHHLAIAVLGVMQGGIVALGLLLAVFGVFPDPSFGLVILGSNCVMLLVLLVATAPMFIDF
jgi:hypothetical protein